MVVPVPTADGLFALPAEEPRVVGASEPRQVHEMPGAAGERQVPGSPTVGYQQPYGTAGVST